MSEQEIIAACARFMGWETREDSSKWFERVSTGLVYVADDDWSPLRSWDYAGALLVQAAEKGLDIWVHHDAGAYQWSATLLEPRTKGATAYESTLDSDHNAKALRAICTAVATYQAEQDAREEEQVKENCRVALEAARAEAPE